MTDFAQPQTKADLEKLREAYKEGRRRMGAPVSDKEAEETFPDGMIADLFEASSDG